MGHTTRDGLSPLLGKESEACVSQTGAPCKQGPACIILSYGQYCHMVNAYHDRRCIYEQDYIYREIYREIYMFDSSIGWSMNARASLAVAAAARFSTQD